MSKRKGYRPQRKYTPHTAKEHYECLVCGGTISPGDIYIGRRMFKGCAYRGSIRKSGQCITIKEVKGDEERAKKTRANNRYRYVHIDNNTDSKLRYRH